jgi:hypothetical protein
LLAQVDAGAPIGPLSIVSDGPLERDQPLTLDGSPAGRVAHGGRSPGLGGWCGVARVRSELLASGLSFGAADGQVVRSVASPAVIPTSWSSLQGSG